MCISLGKHIYIETVGVERSVGQDNNEITYCGKIQLRNFCDVRQICEQPDRISTSYAREFVESLKQIGSKYEEIKKYFLCIHIIGKTIGGSWQDTSTVRVHGFLWDKLRELDLSDFKLKLQITFEATFNGADRAPVTVKAEMPVIPQENIGTTDAVHEACIDEGERLVEDKNATPIRILDLSNKINPHTNLRAFVNVSLVSKEAEPRPQPSQFTIINKKILDSQIQSDISVVARNGAEVKCHKNFLAAHSSVLAEMFEKELQTKKIQMADMSEDGVRAFLAYLYTLDSKVPNENFKIALELLQAGHKYDISTLKSEMTAIFLRMPPAWVDSEVGLRLFLFARNVDGCDELKQKAVEVLKFKSKDMLESKFYKDLIKENVAGAAEAAFELFALISVQNMKPN